MENSLYLLLDTPIARHPLVPLMLAEALAELLARRRRGVRRQLQGFQVCEQGVAALLVQQALRRVLPLRAGRLVVAMPCLGKGAEVFVCMMPIENRREMVGQMALEG